MFKLTLVSVWFRGSRVSAFLRLPVDQNGKVHANGCQINELLKLAGMPNVRGLTFSTGV